MLSQRAFIRLTCAATNSHPQVPVNGFKYKGLSLDAAGTLITVTEPPGVVYSQFAAKHGIDVSEQDTSVRFKTAFRDWPMHQLRYVGDGVGFWRHVVSKTIGSDDQDLFQDLYQYYAGIDAWCLASGALDVLHELNNARVKLTVVSNFDTRLEPILRALHVRDLFDHVVVSADVGAEKPSPAIFEKALDLMGLKPSEVVHVGDVEENDVVGARGVGMEAWLWGKDVKSYQDVLQKMKV